MLSSRRLFVTFRGPLFQRPLTPRSSLRRHFSQTPTSHATESPDSFITNFKHTKIFQQLADKPEALSALQVFVKLLQENGVDTSSGRPPSTMQMFKLAANPEFREGAKRVVEELKKAGVDLSSQEAVQELMNLKKRSDGDS